MMRRSHSILLEHPDLLDHARNTDQIAHSFDRLFIAEPGHGFVATVIRQRKNSSKSTPPEPPLVPTGQPAPATTVIQDRNSGVVLNQPIGSFSNGLPTLKDPAACRIRPTTNCVDVPSGQARQLMHQLIEPALLILRQRLTNKRPSNCSRCKSPMGRIQRLQTIGGRCRPKPTDSGVPDVPPEDWPPMDWWLHRMICSSRDTDQGRTCPPGSMFARSGRSNDRVDQTVDPTTPVKMSLGSTVDRAASCEHP